MSITQLPLLDVRLSENPLLLELPTDIIVKVSRPLRVLSRFDEFMATNEETLAPPAGAEGIDATPAPGLMVNGHDTSATLNSPPPLPGEAMARIAPPERTIDLPPSRDIVNIDGDTIDAVPSDGVPEATLDGDGSMRTPYSIDSADAASDFVPGYELLGELGRGGMGVVYKARHTRLNRVIALKMVLAGGHASSADLARFVTEAEAVASLQHPNIVQIFETGRHEGLPYFTLEYMAGGSLTGQVKDLPLAPREAAAIVEKLSRAMHYAHARGIVHRDLKPDNVLLAADGTPKITDFGLAKKVEGGSGMTQTGAIMGTPSFMAPEQAAGKGKDVGPAADIYSLGAMLYRLLTGRPPFQAASPLETVLMVVHDDPVPPSRLLSKLPRDLETICMKCLEKEPHRRYETADDLADDLARFLRGETVRARPVRPWERWIKWARRHPSTAALIALGTLAVIGGTMYAVNEQWRERRRVETVRARVADAAAKGKEAMARSDWSSAILQFDQAGDALTGAPELQGEFVEVAELQANVLGRRRADETLATFTRLRDESLLQAARSIGGGSATQQKVAVQKLEAALECVGYGRGASGALKLPAGFEPAQREEIAAGCYELLLVLAEATAQALLGQSPASQTEQIGAALGLMDRAATLGFAAHPTQAFHLRRARFLDRAGRKSDAEAERVRAAGRPPTSAIDHYLVGDEHYKEGDVARAVSSFETVLRLQPQHFWARYFLALCQLRLQQPELAKAHLTACLGQRPDAATRAWIFLMRGYAHGQLGRTRKDELTAAEKDFESALEALRQPGAARDADAEYALFNNRGVMRLQNQQHDAGIADLQSAVRLNPRQHHAHVSLAMALQQTHHWREAIDELGEAIRIAGELVAAGELDAASLAPLHRNRAQTHLERWQQRARLAAAGLIGAATAPPAMLTALMRLPPRDDEALAAARADLERAVEILQPSPDVAARSKALVQLGQVHQLGDRHREALDAFQRALRATPNAPEPHRRRAQSLLKLGRYMAAEQGFTAYLELCRTSGAKPAGDVFLARGLTRERLGRPAAAADDYTQSLALEPNGENGQTLARRARALLAANRPHPALLDFDEAVRLKSDSTEVLAGRAHARARLGRFEGAIADAEDALRRGPTTPTLLHAVARVHALAVAGAESGAWQPAAGVATRSTLRVLDLIDESLRLAGPKANYLWGATIRLDGSLGSIRQTARFRRLEREHTPRMFEVIQRANRSGEVPQDELVDAARLLALAVEAPVPEAYRPDAPPVELKANAVALVKRLLMALPSAERANYWVDAIEPDAALTALRDAPEFVALKQLAMRTPAP